MLGTFSLIIVVLVASFIGAGCSTSALIRIALGPLSIRRERYCVALGLIVGEALHGLALAHVPLTRAMPLTSASAALTVGIARIGWFSRRSTASLSDWGSYVLVLVGTAIGSAFGPAQSTEMVLEEFGARAFRSPGFVGYLVVNSILLIGCLARAHSAKHSRSPALALASAYCAGAVAGVSVLLFKLVATAIRRLTRADDAVVSMPTVWISAALLPFAASLQLRLLVARGPGPSSATMPVYVAAAAASTAVVGVVGLDEFVGAGADRLAIFAAGVGISAIGVLVLALRPRPLDNCAGGCAEEASTSSSDSEASMKGTAGPRVAPDCDLEAGAPTRTDLTEGEADADSVSSADTVSVHDVDSSSEFGE